MPAGVARGDALREGVESEERGGERRYDFKFHLDFETGQAVFELPGLELGADGTAPDPDPSASDPSASDPSAAASDSPETPEVAGASGTAGTAGATSDEQPAEPSA